MTTVDTNEAAGFPSDALLTTARELLRGEPAEVIATPEMRERVARKGAESGDEGGVLVVATPDLELTTPESETLARLPTETRLVVLSCGPPSAAPVLLQLLELGVRFHAARRLADGWVIPGAKGLYRVRPYRPGDEDEILDLFRSSFHVERTRTHWAWKYEDHPHGAHRISLVEDPDGALVAQYCAYPALFDLPHRDGVAAHQVGDTMTAPHVRSVGRGPSSILATAAEHFYRTRCRGEVAFNYGYNTGNIQRFSMRYVGAEKIEDVAFRSAPRTRFADASTPLFDRVQESAGFSSDFDRLYERARPRYGALLRRDAAYLRWRYQDCPDTTYRTFELRRWGRLRGWGVFTQRDDALVWGDALFDGPHPMGVRALLGEAARQFEASGNRVRSIVAWFPERPAWWSDTLEALGFQQGAEPQDLGLVVVPFDSQDTPRGGLAPALRASLYYSYGDSDLF